MDGRLIVADGGIASAAAHLARDRADLFDPRAPGAMLRFGRCQPSVLIGCFQRFADECRIEYCREHGIAVARRLSGGGAIYVDQAQLIWSLIVRGPGPWSGRGLGPLLADLCQAIAEGLKALGIPAELRRPNDVEVHGRKLASGFLACTGNGFLFEGTLLLDVDIERALSALRLPTEKLSQSGLESARQRLITLRELLGTPPTAALLQQALAGALAHRLALAPHCGAAARTQPRAIAAAPAPRAEAGGVVSEAFWRAPGGRLRARLAFDEAGLHVLHAAVTGDLFARPDDLFERLAAALAGSPLAEVERRARGLLAATRAEMLDVTPDDVVQVLRRAMARLAQQHLFGLSLDEANRLMVLDARSEQPADAIIAQASVMLVPYCAKLVGCKWRYRDGCPECGACEVGEAYRLGREQGMRVVTIYNYEHLCTTLAQMREQGVEAFVGMCCERFFVKRHQAFADSGIPMVLLDVTGSNCYELRQEEQAYAGSFQAQARLDVELLRKLLRRRAPRGAEAAPQG